MANVSVYDDALDVGALPPPDGAMSQTVRKMATPHGTNEVAANKVAANEVAANEVTPESNNSVLPIIATEQAVVSAMDSAAAATTINLWERVNATSAARPPLTPAAKNIAKKKQAVAKEHRAAAKKKWLTKGVLKAKGALKARPANRFARNTGLFQDREEKVKKQGRGPKGRFGTQRSAGGEPGRVRGAWWRGRGARCVCTKTGA